MVEGGECTWGADVDELEVGGGGGGGGGGRGGGRGGGGGGGGGGGVVGVHPVVFEYIWGGVEFLSWTWILSLRLKDGPREMPIFDV